MNGFRLFMAASIGLVLAGVIYWGAFSKTRKADPTLHSARYDPIFNPFQLVWIFAILAVAGMVIARSRMMVLPLMISLVLEIAVYYGALLIVLPLLRKVFRPSTVAALWLLPNLLYITCYNYMQPSGPKLVLPVSVGFSHWPLLVWGVGFFAVMGWAVFRHLAFRRELLRDAEPVTDPDILSIWNEEKDALGLQANRLPKIRSTHLTTSGADLFRSQVPVSVSDGQTIPTEMRSTMEADDFDPALLLVRSGATATPLSIGIWRRTTRVVLPQRTYTPEELRLILRHELIHIRHQDPSTKLFLTFCQAACWFNPLMWFAMRRCADDLELGCDELVLADADNNTRETYARLVLRTAGDERGFTTCLSTRAKSLRYRLQGIVTERKRLAGGLLVGLVVVALLMSNGLVAVAYAPSRGEDAIFHGRSADCEPEKIYSLPDAKWHPFQYEYYTCKDPSALRQYLSELELYHISGLYDPQDDYLFVSYSDVSVQLYDRMIQVTRFLTPTETETQLFYCPRGVDMDRLMSLLEEMP